MALGELYCWVLSPKDGLVKFWQRTIVDRYSDENLITTVDWDDLVGASLYDTHKV